MEPYSIRPVWVGNYIPRYRAEEDGFYSIPILGTQEIFGMNKVDVELLKLCNGLHTLENIHKSLEGSVGIKVDQSRLLETLYVFRNIGLIRWDKEKDYDEKNKSGYIFGIREGNYGNVSTFLRKSVIRKRAMYKTLNYKGDKRFILLSRLDYSYYETLAIRGRLKKGIQKMFGFCDDGMLKGVIVIDLPFSHLRNKIVTISGLVVEDYLNNEDKIEQLIECVIKNINRKKYKKIRIYVPTRECINHQFFCNEPLLNKLKVKGFFLEGVFRNEILNNIDIQLWARLI